MCAFLTEVWFFMILVHFAICGKVAFKVTEGASDFWTNAIFRDFEKSPIGIGYNMLGRQHANHVFATASCVARIVGDSALQTQQGSTQIGLKPLTLKLHEFCTRIGSIYRVAGRAGRLAGWGSRKHARRMHACMQVRQACEFAACEVGLP